MTRATQTASEFAHHWALDPSLIFLNHGSFGSCPLVVLEEQQRLRERMERNPVQFLRRERDALLDHARETLAGVLGASAETLVFLRNTTTGINTVLRGLPLKSGDEVLVTSHAYNASRNALEHAAKQAGAVIVTAPIPFPLSDPGAVIESVLQAVTPRTRLALLDHVTSATGLVLPIERLVHELDRRGVETLVDGAHAPGMVPLNLEHLGAAYYVGNCHKWLCAPKGAAFLCVRSDRKNGLRPLVISHGANSARTDRSRLHLEFDWTGTDDLTPWLSVPAAIRFLESLRPDGLVGLMERNQSLAIEARESVCRDLGAAPPCPEEMLGSLAAIVLPNGAAPPTAPPFANDPLEVELLERYRIEVLISVWPDPPRRLLRLSAHAYNSLSQYEYLAHALRECLAL